MHSFGSGAEQQPQVDRLVAGLANGNSMLIVSPLPTAALLTAIEGLLRRTRILRVAPPLALPAFMEQIAANAGTDTGSLEQGFNALTTLDATCDRIALIVEDAHLLPPETLRYIDLSFWSAPSLQVILAGRPEISDVLALEGYTSLRKRLAFKIVVPSPSPLPPDKLRFAAPKLITARRPEFGAGPSRALTSRAVSFAGAAMGAAIVLAMFAVRPLPLGGPDNLPAAIAMVELNPASISSTAEPSVAQPVLETLTLEPSPMPAHAAPAIETEPPVDAGPTVSAGVQPDMTGSMPVPDPELSRPLVADGAEPPTAPAGTPATEPPGESPPMDTALLVPDPGPEPSPDSPAATAPASATAGPAEPALIIPAIAAPRPAPPIPKRSPPRLAAQPAPVRVERATSQSDPALASQQRCRAIVQRALIGENPTDVDVLFLRNGCR